jgi:secreted PhoX family phosphatase
MAKDFDMMEDSNRSANPSIHEVSGPDRRTVLRGGIGITVATLLGPLAACKQVPLAPVSPLGFASVPVSSADTVVVPPGYTAQVIAPWGDPVGIAGNLPAFLPDAGNTADEQAVQMGMHHDGMHYFALDGSDRGLLVMNHEYVDDGLLHPDGTANWSAEKVRKGQAAHGVSVIEVAREGDGWNVVRPSRYARRISTLTPVAVSGPAAGHPLMRTAADPSGQRVLGTLNNCASGITPWGTYLTGEENFILYFNGPDRPDAHAARWGLTRRGVGMRWAEHDERFDAVRHPNEPNRFGWIVEIDPMDPTSTPVKRTALGRAAHEGATVAVTRDGRAVVYSGEDAQFEYVYKFVSRDRIAPGGAAANRTLLDHGTLYAARFDADGRGRWLPLVAGHGPLTAEAGFADQGEVVVKTRQASDLLGATKMDRPEWIAVDASTGEVYCSLTNNSKRGAPGQPGVDAANPRARNVWGQVIRWKEDGDFDGTTFTWSHFVLAGGPEHGGTVRGDLFASPDGLWIDPRGVLWIQTDNSSSTGTYGNNMMLAADPATGEVRRFLTGPRQCEVTGVTSTPDLRTLFVNIQHPGESPVAARNEPAWPSLHSRWPDGGRPRSATVVVRRHDGGVVGT